MYYLSEYQTFDSVREMNENVQMHYNGNYSGLNNTNRAVLSLISRYVCKYVLKFIAVRSTRMLVIQYIGWNKNVMRYR